MRTARRRVFLQASGWLRSACLTAIAGFALCAQASDFDVANGLYDQGKFAEARAAYLKLVNAGQRSANLFYNLGNASQRIGKPGEAALDYERALALDPSHPEAQANLRFVREHTGAIPWPRSWMDRIFPESWADAFVIAGSIAAWGFVFSVFGLFTSRNRDRFGLWFAAISCFFIAACSAAGIWSTSNGRGRAIVTAATAQVHLAPAGSAAAAGVLPAGSEVRVLSERGDWIYCVLPAQGRGWIAAGELERVRLGDS